MKLHLVGLVLALATGVVAVPSIASAEIVFSAYGGVQQAFDSGVSGSDPSPGGVGDFDFNQRWEGNSFKTPAYWGVRGTWWLDNKPNWGISLEYTHAKVYADPKPDGWDTFEFTDGLNLFTANVLYRFQKEGRAWTPYIGAGAGLSVPHVEVQTSPTAARTFEYQVGGAAFQIQAGVDYRINDWLSVFGEYKGNYAMNDLDLKGGGSMDTDIFTNAFNIGVSFHFNPR
jgi:lipid A oxidase